MGASSVMVRKKRQCLFWVELAMAVCVNHGKQSSPSSPCQGLQVVRLAPLWALHIREVQSERKESKELQKHHIFRKRDL